MRDNFNPRPLMRGGDDRDGEQPRRHANFNPRPLMRGGDRRERRPEPQALISIHAPSCEGATRWTTARGRRSTNFNPRPLMRGGDLGRRAGQGRGEGFQSTPPHARGRPGETAPGAHHAEISIHAPSCEGATALRFRSNRTSRYFNPRPLMRGGDLRGTGCRPAPANFNPRPLMRGGDRPRGRGGRFWKDFNPRPLMRGGDRYI